MIFTIDFLDNFNGWFTYDVYGLDKFDAACELMRHNPEFKIKAIN